MSDSEIIFDHDNLDVIDEQWARDYLSDDEIEVTPGNDDQDINTTVTSNQKRDEDKWTDLGLDGIGHN